MPEMPYAARTATGTLPTRLVPPDFRTAPPPLVARTGLATASLVLGIVSLVANLLLLPTILSVTFGIVSLAKGTAARGRAIAGIVLGVLGLLLLGVWASIAIPVFVSLQSAAVDSGVKAVLSNDKTALVGYATDNGGLPRTAVPAELAKYGWDDSATVTSLSYGVRGTGASEAFCLLATSARGAHFVVTSHTAVARADACPAEW